MFPTTPSPTAQGMNYTVVVGGGWIVLCIIYYYFPVYGGVHWFKGPMANVELETESLSKVERVSVSLTGEKEFGEDSQE